MITLSSLTNSHRPRKKVQRVGRGPGSRRGKTCKRGNKGDKARCGYKQRYGEEGGQKALYRRLPIRGFNHGRFRVENREVTFEAINTLFEDGEKVNRETLKQRGISTRNPRQHLKVLATGKLKKKVSIEANAFSNEAKSQLDKQSIAYKVI